MKMDVTIIRLGWVLLTLLGGSGIIAYIIAYFIIPLQPIEGINSNQPMQSDLSISRIFGIVLVVVGIVVLLDNLEILSFYHWWHMSREFVLPGMLILIGIYFITKRVKISAPSTPQTPNIENEQRSQEQTPTPTPSTEETRESKMLRRSLTDKKLLGVCGGAGEYFDIDPTIVRIGYAVFTILSGGMGILLYFLLYLIIPEEQRQPTKQQ
jgi:phage shock protein C